MKLSLAFADADLAQPYAQLDTGVTKYTFITTPIYQKRCIMRSGESFVCLFLNDAVERSSLKSVGTAL